MMRHAQKCLSFLAGNSKPGILGLLLVLNVIFQAPVNAQSPDLRVDRLLGNSKFGQTREAMARDFERIAAEAVRLSGASPDEQHSFYAAALADSGLTDITTDANGNVFAVRKGAGNGRVVAVSVHARHASAILLSFLRTLNTLDFKTASDFLIIMAAEGQPASSGIRELLSSPSYKDSVKSFVELEPINDDEILNSVPAAGDEPAVQTHVSLDVVQVATAVIKELGGQPTYRSGISEVRLPMSMGIPAIAIGAGARADLEQNAVGHTAAVVSSVLLSLAGIP